MFVVKTIRYLLCAFALAFSSTAGAASNYSSLVVFGDSLSDPGNAAAKYDLELALRNLLAAGVRVGAGQQTGAGSTGRRGAGAGIPGSGY